MSAPKISLALGAKRQTPAPKNGIKRPRAALQDEEDEGEDFGRTEAVSHFDKTAGGAIDSSRKQEFQGPLIIPKQLNRNWKEAANQRKRQKSGLPEGASGGRGGLDQRVAAVEAELEAAKPKFGLNTYARAEAGNADATASDVMDAVEKTQQLPPEPNPDEEPLRKQTDEERALDALLGKTTTDKTLVITASKPLSEEDVFNDDIASAPPMPSMDDYARMPVEQFGAALLRGMGWKDGEGVGNQRGVKLKKESAKPPAKRSNLLGIGAKEDAAIAGEMGAWGRGAKGKEVKIYNPVLLKDTKTGEMFTEEELKAKQERDEKAKYEMEWEKSQKEKKRSERSERGAKDDRRRDQNRGDSRDRRREKDRRGDDGRRRDGSRDRARNRNSYDDDDESDGTYRRRKDRERLGRRDEGRDRRNGEDRRHRDRDEHDRRRRDREESDRHRNHGFRREDREKYRR